MTTMQSKYLQGADRVRRVILLGTPNLSSVSALHSFIKGFKIGAGVDYDLVMLEPGDGTVTKASLLARESLDPSIPRHKWLSFPLDYPIFLCESHNTLTGNVTFQDSLLHTLLSRVQDE